MEEKNKNKTVLGQKASLDAESRRKELTIPQNCGEKVKKIKNLKIVLK